ncbi:STN domain-containing protein [Emticicia sp. BO119]|uniref:STN domain-containing protein n=1 Tax=Emticicia sp. BO119 TaxID=2757768 RepID=UPI0015F0E516|nr:STN domain-containing protein [Emticicia sp. BO119]MBA4853312.1 STN domain-containing protein [Emticicia sp. BO119]
MKKLLTFIFFLHLYQSFAQNVPPLERIITIKISDEKLDNALKGISEVGNFSFSYNPSEIDINKRVSASVQNQPVREVLNLIFSTTATFKNKGNYIILKKNDEEPKKDFFVMGYVSDGETGLKIEKASVYEPITLASAVTNQYGYYRLKIPTTVPIVSVQIRKQNYHNGEMAVKGRTNTTLNITLLPIKPIRVSAEKIEPIAIRRDTFPQKKIDSIAPIQIAPLITIQRDSSISNPKKSDYQDYWNETKDRLAAAQRHITDWLITTRQNIHLDNIGDTIYRPVQVSLLPFIGTNHYLSGNVINEYSFNIIAGYSLGITKLEIGGFLNLVKGNVSGVQAAGFANLVGETVKGAQWGGFANIVGQSAYGIQGAGFGNLVFRNFSGIQGAGFMNVVLHSTRYAVQGAGFGNLIMGSGSGVQAAGFANLVRRDFDGVQVSGFINYTGGTFKGLQVGVVNAANRVNDGLQIGVLNLTEQSNSIPIGLVSFVKRGGYRRLELNIDEVNLANITFKTGVKRFYNIFTAGYGFNEPNKPLFSFGYGLGTAWRLNRAFWLNFDIVSSHLQNDVYNWELNQLIRGSLGLELHLSPRIAIFLAPSISFHATQESEINLGQLNKLKFYEEQGRYFGERATLSSWLGYQAGIRICNF